MANKTYYEKILGHNINNKVHALIEKVISYFPHKKLLVHPISIAETELRETYRYNVNGISKPRLSRYIGIWINENLSTNEFNIILAEEIYHHIQAYYKYPAIFGLNDDLNMITFRNGLNSSVLDMDAHYHLIKRGLNLTPIQNLDYLEAIDSNNTVTHEELFQHSQYYQYAMLFPQYLLWWYDLEYLSSHIKEKWETDINQWFINNTSPQTHELWSSLIRFVKKNPCNSKQSVKISMTEICRTIIGRMPAFIDISTTGLEINLILRELVPIERPLKFN